MVDGMLSLVPMARVGHIGLYRDPETLEPVEYYYKLPDDIANRDVVVLDPMLATGGSACDAVEILKKHGQKISSSVISKEGVRRLSTEHPDVGIYVQLLMNILMIWDI